MMVLSFMAAMVAQASVSGVDAVAERLAEDYPAPAVAVVLVTTNGEPEVGLAGTRRIDRDEPVTEEDLWHIGSNAKAMTATLAMALVEDGLISLETTVSEQLGGATKVHEAWSEVTLEQLLSHRSGTRPNVGRWTMVRYIAFPSSAEDGPARDRRSVLRGVLKKPPETDGGSFIYSNLGYTIAGAMLGNAAGTTYEEAISRHLFEPLGMEAVLVGAPTGSPGTYNSGHQGDPLVAAPAGADNPALMSPAGTFSLTPAAYAAFLQDQLIGHSGGEALLSTDSYRELRSVRGEDDEDYALGWGITDEGWLSHSGSNTVWYVVALIAPDRGMAAAILTNAPPTNAVGRDLRELIEAHSEGEIRAD